MNSATSRTEKQFVMTRIHIVGATSRTGTTLMAELMNSCFRIGGYAAHEMSIFRRPDRRVDLLVTKCPTEATRVIPVLAIDPELFVICMVRDPRDVAVSRHGNHSDHYWTSLREWKEAVDAIKAANARYPDRYLLVKYEDLVGDPDSVQRQLLQHWPFLDKLADFSRYHEVARPSEDSLSAMRGLRPISSSSVGSWVRHKPRLAAQLKLHGGIDEYLYEFGYEENADWKQALEDVQPDNGKTYKPEFEDDSFRMRFKRRYRQISRLLRYRFGGLRKYPIIVSGSD